MTGGVVVILGAVGNNFAAGMTGGRAFVYDIAASFEGVVNPDSVVWRRFVAGEEECKRLIERHAGETRSVFARQLLDDWKNARDHFWEITPKEMLARSHVLEDAQSLKSA